MRVFKRAIVLAAFAMACMCLPSFAQSPPLAILTQAEFDSYSVLLSRYDSFMKSTRSSAKDELKKINPSVKSRLQSASRDGSALEKTLAICVLAASGDPSARNGALMGLRSSDSSARYWAAVAMRDYVDGQSFKSFADALEDESYGLALSAMTEALGALCFEKDKKFVVQVKDCADALEKSNLKQFTPFRYLAVTTLRAYVDQQNAQQVSTLLSYPDAGGHKAYLKFKLLYLGAAEDAVAAEYTDFFLKQSNITSQLLAFKDDDCAVFAARSFGAKKAFVLLLEILSVSGPSARTMAAEAIEKNFDPKGFYQKFAMCSKLADMTGNQQEFSYLQNGAQRTVTIGRFSVEIISKISSIDFFREGEGKAVEISGQWWARAKDGIFRESVNVAIKEGIKYLRATQLPDGRVLGNNRNYASYELGLTSLYVYMMVKSDTPVSDASVEKAVNWIIGCNGGNNTYEKALECMALATVLMHTDQSKKSSTLNRKKIMAALVEAAEWLIGAQARNGGWTYGLPGTQGDQYDHSNTQFAMMGLFAAELVGVKVPAKVWKVAETHFLDDQHKNGGWSYAATPSNGPEGGETPAMSSAGIVCLLIADYENRKASKGDSVKLEEPANKKQIEAGFEFLKSRAVSSFARTSGANNLYELYSIERACMMFGVQKLGEVDWYRAGAEMILNAQAPDGKWDRNYGDLVDTCFSILFLKRAYISGAAVQSGGK